MPFAKAVCQCYHLEWFAGFAEQSDIFAKAMSHEHFSDHRGDPIDLVGGGTDLMKEISGEITTRALK